MMMMGKGGDVFSQFILKVQCNNNYHQIENVRINYTIKFDFGQLLEK